MWTNTWAAETASSTDRREVALLRLAFVFLVLAALGLSLSPVVRLGNWSAFGRGWGHWLVLPVWLACAVVAHGTLRRRCPQRDPYLLPTGLLLAGWGLMTIWRVAPAFGLRQTGWLALGTVLLLVVVRQPADLRWLRRYRYLWLTGGVFLLSLTLVFGTNPSGGAPRLWLGCCGFYFQPSEPLRLLLVAYLAAYFADRLGLGWTRGPLQVSRALAPLLFVWGISVALLAVQRDLGTGSLFLWLLAVLLYLATGRPLVLAVAGLLTLAGAALGYALVDVVRLRVDTWLSPWTDPIGGAYQLVQSMIALASGGLLGTGPGLGAPGFVPVAHSDFIFAAIAEEWGLAGGVAMLGLLAVLVSRGLRLAARARNAFAALLAAGLAVTLGLQAVLIIAGVLRLLPLTGITLPFVSYGGSSLVTSMVALGLLLLMPSDEAARRWLALPLRHLQAAMAALWMGLALALGWWAVVRAPDLVARTDNPRRALAARFVPRGRILDRGGEVLAETVGQRGSYRRRYPDPVVAPIVGYDSLRYGQAGVEAVMDPWLRGEAGHPALEVAWRRLLTGFPPPGLDLRLTVDLALQRGAAEALGGRRGAVVVLDPLSGEVLALVSSPSYDPNLLDQTWPGLVARGDAPLLNRATQGRYQPGTALGPLILAGGLEAGLVDAEMPVAEADGPLALNGERLVCALTPASPRLADGIRAGCPRPLAEAGRRLGGERLLNVFSALGLADAVEIRLESAPPVVVRASEVLADPVRWAVGQGGLTVTPLQMARAFGALMAVGTRPVLRLVDAVATPGGEWQGLPALESPPQRVLNAEAAQTALEALRDPATGRVEVIATAQGGEAPAGLAWHLIGDNGPTRTLAVVVLLEARPASEAQRIGRTVLGLARSVP